MSTGEPEASDAVARQLVAQAQFIAKLQAELDELAHEATDAVAGLIARIEQLETDRPAGARAPAAWCWRNLGEHASQELTFQLTDWVDWLRGRYPLARKIPPCWAEHPEVVEELTALWLAWQDAYQGPNPSLTAAADWHDRWLPGVLYRLEHGPFALQCTTQHEQRPESAYASHRPFVKRD